MTEIFGNIGMGTLGLLFLLLALVVILFILLHAESRKRQALEERLARFMDGGDGMSLEDSIVKMFEEHDELLKSQEDNRKDISRLYNRIRTMIQKVGVVKYDAFNQMGGNLSSSIALLDEDNNGFIINTVQSVDGCYSYVKEIRDGSPDIDLGKEEAEALEKAMNFCASSVAGAAGETGKVAGRKKPRTRDRDTIQLNVNRYGR